MRAINKSDVEDPQRLYYVIRELQDVNLSVRRDMELQVDANQKEMAKVKTAMPKGSVLDGVTDGPTAFTKLGIDPLASKKSDISATVSPGATDDESSGYDVGSIKIIPTASAEEMWVCMNPAKGAAVWKKFTLV